MNRLNWDGFRYFIAVAESGSLSAAARIMDSNQPTVGRYVDALENDLGVKLFQRSVKGLALTSEGQLVYEQSKDIYHSVIKIQRLSQDGAEEVSGSVRLSLPEGLAYEILLPSLDDFYCQYPEVNLVVDISSTAANLTRGEADVALRLFRPDEADLVVKHLGEMTMGLYACSDYKEKYGLPSGINDLKNFRLIAYGDQLSQLPENQWLLKHSDNSSCVFYSDSTQARLKATLASTGISIQPDRIAGLYPELIRVFKTTDIPAHKIWLVYHNDLRSVARVRAVIDFLSEKITGKVNNKS